MCMEDIRIGRSLKTNFLSLAQNVNNGYLVGRGSRVRLIVSGALNADIYASRVPGSSLQNSIRVWGSGHNAFVMRIEEWGDFLRESLYWQTNPVNNSVTLLDVFLDREIS